MKMSEADKIIESLKNSGRKVEEFYTGNKTSDINVGNIEEDIKILENLKSYLNLLVYEGKDKIIYNDLLWDEKTVDCINAIEHLINNYTRQKQINEEHQKINGELREKVKELDTKNDELLKDLYNANCIIADLTDSIPIQKIQDKLEELDKQEQELQNSITEEEREKYEDANISYLLCDIENRREVLKELLQEGNK